MAEDRISRNIWKGNNFKLGKPYGLSYARTRPKMSNRYVFTENGTFNLDGEDAHVGEENESDGYLGIARILYMVGLRK